MTSKQEIFSPLNVPQIGFRWTQDGSTYGWYAFDQTEAELAAKTARDARAKELTRQGHKVKKFALRNQLISRGGIGSGHPHIQLYINVYGLNIFS